ncbi:hypothetical protein [Brevibacillus sp. NL20B1]|uniref:hypothetical protein n=1 Tax=Brevibacillus sp. NL20B1 TaxID=2829799 RepID=UPI001B923F2F|nr:hypothetical protein [Brevibacillus sp. NL20B1]MBR8660714.1 hypothetical protein [Brevibacillus sp. NL20B1]
MDSRKSINWSEYLELEDVQDGLVILSNGRYRKYLEIFPIPLTHCSEKELRNVYLGWQDFLRTLEIEIALYIQSRQVDLEEVMKRQRENRINFVRTYNASGSMTEVFLMEQEHFNRELLVSRNLPVRRNFLVFPLEDPTRSPEKANDFLNDRIEESLVRIQRFVRRYKRLETPDVYDILHAWCNKKQSKYISGNDLYEKGFHSLFVKGVPAFA